VTWLNTHKVVSVGTSRKVTLNNAASHAASLSD
jgi:hypothetical protein